MGNNRSRIKDLFFSVGLILAAFATNATAQVPASAVQAQAAWRSVKTYLEAGPMLLASPNPVVVRLTGEPCNSRVVVVDWSGPVDSGLMQWRALGRATAQPVEEGHVVAFANGGWFAFPPFEAGHAQAAARAFDELVQICEQVPLTEGQPAGDRFAELQATLQRLKTELEAVVATDTASRRFTYRVDETSTACHFNVVALSAGERGLLDDNYITIRPNTTFNLIPQPPVVVISIPGLGSDHLATDTPARAQTVLSLLNQMRGLCAEFQTTNN